MKKIVCEMCDGMDFSKEDGKFICQNCGMKYSIEEAKKLMVEVEEKDGGTPSAAADENQKIANLRKLADRAREDEDSEMAAKYYEQLMIECPDDWEARFYTTYYAAHNIKIAQIGSAAAKVSNIIGPTFQMILDSCDEAERLSACLRITTAVIGFSTMLFNNITSNLGSDIEYAARNVDNWAVPTLTMLIVLGDEIQAKFDNVALDEVAQSVYNAAHNYSDAMKDFTPEARKLHKLVLSRISAVKAKISNRKAKKEAEEKKQRFETYWREHAEEKEQLENEKKQLKIKIGELQKELEAVSARINPQIQRLEEEKKVVLPEEKAVKDQEKLIHDLRMERQSLGIFKGKQKKALNVRITEVEEPKLKEMKAAAKAARDELNSRLTTQIYELNKESQKYRTEINQLNSRISAIDKELTKER